MSPHLTLHIVCLWLFFIPIAVANATPVLVRRIPLCSKPIRTKWLWKHKTYRWFIFGVLLATLVWWLAIDKWSYIIFSSKIFHFWVSDFSPYVVSAWLWFSALLGDSIKSYRKRRFGVPSWWPFPPWDQIDYIIGACLLTSRYINRSLIDVLILCLVWWIMSAISHYVAYLLGLINTKQ